MKKPYSTPELLDYGPIAERTSMNPRSEGTKGGVLPCAHTDMWLELSGLTGCDT